MILTPGLRIGLAPRFHSDLPWLDRLQVNSGATLEGGNWLPRPDWRSPTAAELDLLLAGGPSGGAWERDVCLFRFPEHLRLLWWERAAGEVLAQEGGSTGYEAFVAEVM